MNVLFDLALGSRDVIIVQLEFLTFFLVNEVQKVCNEPCNEQ